MKDKIYCTCVIGACIKLKDKGVITHTPDISCRLCDNTGMLENSLNIEYC